MCAILHGRTCLSVGLQKAVHDVNSNLLQCYYCIVVLLFLMVLKIRAITLVPLR